MKQSWKPGTTIYPLPAVLVSCGNTPEEYNLITVSWVGTLCTNPPHVLHIRSTGKTFLRDSKKKHGVRNQSHDRSNGKSNRLVRRFLRKEL